MTTPKFGDKTTGVKGLQAGMQKRLIGLGLDEVVLKVDGDFGPQTANVLAVLFNAERELRLTPAGVVAHDAASGREAWAVTTHRDVPWLKIARGELGQKEVHGARDNPRIVQYHAATTLRATDDEVF